MAKVLSLIHIYAGVAELADAQASGACGSNIVWVQVPSPACLLYTSNAALFIDGENISSKKAEQIQKIANKQGVLGIEKVYGLQKDECTKSWSDKAKKLDIKDIRSVSYTHLDVYKRQA